MAALVKEGSVVERRRDWDLGCDLDGVPPGPGLVVSVNQGSVDVKWQRTQREGCHLNGFEA